jgi:hypothetical protein
MMGNGTASVVPKELQAEIRLRRESRLFKAKPGNSSLFPGYFSENSSYFASTGSTITNLPI